MQLRCLEKGAWNIVEATTLADSSPLTTEMEKISPNRRADVAGILVLFARAAKDGPRSLPKTLVHEVGQGIWQFVKGDLRVLFFDVDGRLVICSHALVKKSRKTPPSDVDKAVRLRERYVAAKTTNSITIT